MRREHDTELARVVQQALAGTSGMAVLVTKSSAGKTRACWEALELLRAAGGWRVWHPRDPTRTMASVAGLDRVEPRTVVWLNETQEYLTAGGDAAEQVAAKLRTLLQDADRAPVLVLGTLWPKHLEALTSRSGSQDRQLLDGAVIIEVPPAFNPADLEALEQAAAHDERLAQALEHAADGHVTQYLAGGPALLERYKAAPPEARAVIEAAMDARRMGHRPALPQALLKDAAAPLPDRHRMGTNSTTTG